MKKLFILALCVLMGCGGIVVIDESTMGGGTGGSETTSNITGGGGIGGSETTTSDGGSTTTTTSSSTTTSTETFVCEAGPKECKEGTCFCPSDHVCCNDPVNYTMCVGNENGYCCPEDMFCIPKE